MSRLGRRIALAFCLGLLVAADRDVAADDPPPDPKTLADALFKSLKSVRPVFVDEFDLPGAVSAVAPKKGDEGMVFGVGYANSRVILKHTRPTGNYPHTPPVKLPADPTNFVCQFTARMTSGNGFGVYFAPRDVKVQAAVKLLDEEKYNVSGVWSGRTAPKFQARPHTAIKPLAEFNTVTVVLSNGKLWIYINGEPTDSPVPFLDQPVPVKVSLFGSGGAEMLVEFDRLVLWGPDAIPAGFK